MKADADQQLLYEYVQGWRLHSQRFRAGRGVDQLAAEERKYRAKEWVIALAVVYAALVSFRHQLWPLLAMALIATAWRIPSFFAQFGLLRKALLGMRPSFRSHPPRSIRLEVSDEGLREFDSGIESFAPWASVRSFRADRRFIEIELSNNLYAYVPVRRLSPASSSREDLLAMLEKQGVAQQRLVHELIGRRPPPKPSTSYRAAPYPFKYFANVFLNFSTFGPTTNAQYPAFGCLAK